MLDLALELCALGSFDDEGTNPIIFFRLGQKSIISSYDVRFVRPDPSLLGNRNTQVRNKF